VLLRLPLLLAALWLLAMTWPPEWWQHSRLPRTGVAYRVSRESGPAVIVLPGYHLPQQFLDDPAYELHRRGFRAVTLDLNRTADPTAAIAELLERFPDAGFYSHSGSVTPTVEAVARTGKGRALVLLGFDPSGRRARPALPDVLLAFGRYDDYLSEAEMLQALASTGGPRPERAGQTVGDGRQRRRLVISPSSAHGGEPFDPFLLEAAAHWLGEPQPTQGIPYSLRHLGWVTVGALLPLPLWACGMLGLAVPLAGTTALLRRGGALLGRHLAAAVAAGLLATWLLHPLQADWALTVAATFLLYVPSQCAGILAERQPQHLLPLLLAAWLPGTKVCQGWLRRWTATCATRPARAVALALAVAGLAQPLEAVRSLSVAVALYMALLAAISPRAS